MRNNTDNQETWDHHCHWCGAEYHDCAEADFYGRCVEDPEAGPAWPGKAA